MSGKRGRDSIQSKATRRFSDSSFDKYFKNQGSTKMSKAPQGVEEDKSLNKKWIKDNLAQNKQYEKVNKLGGKNQGWEDTYSEANKLGMSTKQLEKVARASGNSYEMNEYGFKPHVQNVISQYKQLKSEGYMPGTTLKGFSVSNKKATTYGSYRQGSQEYVINLNAMGVGRIQHNMRKGTLAGKSFTDVAVHELGHAVYYSNKPSYQTKLVRNKKTGAMESRRVKNSLNATEKALRSANAKLLKELNKTSKIQGQSSYVDRVYKQKSLVTGADKKLAMRKVALHESFAEGYVNYINYKRGKGSLTPSGRAVGNYLKEVLKYKK